jgi:hypothetical protein
MTSSPIPTMKAPCRFAHNAMRRGTAKATRGRVLATSSRYSSAENSSSENICGRTGSVAADATYPTMTAPAIRRRSAVRRRQAAATRPQAATVSSAFTTANSGNPPSREMPYSSSWAPQFWSSQGLPAVVQAKASVRGSVWSATISWPAFTW